MTNRTCQNCGRHLITHRADAKFCGQECRNEFGNKRRRREDATAKRLDAPEGGVGTRGGNVRSVDEARQLQTASKPLDRWRLVMEVQIHKTLLETGHFHIDDLDCLNLPAEAFKVRGTLVSSVRRSGVMRSTGVYRKVSHKAANGRPAPIYAITPESRTELQKLVGSCVDTPGGVKVAESPASSHSVPHVGAASSQNENVGLSAAAQLGGPAESGRSAEPGDLTLDAGHSQGKSDQGGALPSSVARIETPEPPEVLQLEIPQESGSSAYGTVFEGEAA